MRWGNICSIFHLRIVVIMFLGTRSVGPLIPQCIAVRKKFIFNITTRYSIFMIDSVTLVRLQVLRWSTGAKRAAGRGRRHAQGAARARWRCVGWRAARATGCGPPRTAPPASHRTANRSSPPPPADVSTPILTHLLNNAGSCPFEEKIT